MEYVGLKGMFHATDIFHCIRLTMAAGVAPGIWRENGRLFLFCFMVNNKKKKTKILTWSYYLIYLKYQASYHGAVSPHALHKCVSYQTALSRNRVAVGML